MTELGKEGAILHLEPADPEMARYIWGMSRSEVE